MLDKKNPRRKNEKAAYKIKLIYNVEVKIRVTEQLQDFFHILPDVYT